VIFIGSLILICGVLNIGYVKRTFFPSKNLISLESKTMYSGCIYKSVNLTLEEYDLARNIAGAP